MDDTVFVQLASTATGLSDESQKNMRSATTAVWTCTDSDEPSSSREMFLILHDIFFF